LFSIDDFFNIFNYLKTGDDNIQLDDTTKNIAISEKIKIEKFFEETIDQEVFISNDYKKFRKLIIDWYSSFKTIVYHIKNASDIYSLPESHINELFKSFGFNNTYIISEMSHENKISFFYELVNLYKIKGTPRALAKLVSFLGLPGVEISEYWLQYDQYNNLIFKSEKITSTSGSRESFNQTIPFTITENDPHWILSEPQIVQLFNEHKISFPIKAPYVSIKPLFHFSDIIQAQIIISKKIHDDYYQWFLNRSLDKNITIKDYDEQISFLELYLACVHLLKNIYNIDMGQSIGKFLHYNGTNQDSSDIILEFNELANYRPISRQDQKEKVIEYTNLFTSSVENNLLNDSSAFEVLELINPSFKQHVENIISLGDEIVIYFIQKFSESSSRLGISSFAISNLILDLGDLTFNFIKEIVGFFKPFRSRLLFDQKTFLINSPLHDSIILEDSIEQEIDLQFVNHATGDSKPGYNPEKTDLTYYSRQTYDTGSYFDAGVCMDSCEVTVNEIQPS